jgi:hypothetical protein
VILAFTHLRLTSQEGPKEGQSSFKALVTLKFSLRLFNNSLFIEINIPSQKVFKKKKRPNLGFVTKTTEVHETVTLTNSFGYEIPRKNPYKIN